MITAYEVVRRLEDGTLVSAFTDDPSTWPFKIRLVYEYGKIIMPPEGSDDGIFCYRRLEDAILSRDISGVVPCTAEVHEVYPIGEEVLSWSGNKRANYPAVLFGRKVADIDGGC